MIAAKKIGFIILLIAGSLFSASAQSNLIMGANKNWPVHFMPVASSYLNMTMGNGSSIVVGPTINLDVLDNLTGNNNASILVSGNLTIDSNFIANNNTNISVIGVGKIVVKGNVVVNNGAKLTISGDLVVNGNLNAGTNSVIDVAGSMGVGGDFNVSSNSDITVDGNIDVSGDFFVGSNSNLDGLGVVDIGGVSNLDPTVVVGADITVNSGTLPVELIDFSVVNIDNQIQLTWTTASEINNDYFTLEKSYDAQVWIQEAVVYGNGNSNQLNTYNYNIQNPENGVYYRLKQTDYDGRFEYVGMVRLTDKMFVNEAKLTIERIFKNENDIRVVVRSGIDTDVAIMVSDIQGKEICRKTYPLMNGVNQFNLPIGLNNGLYIIKVLSEASSDTKKIIF